MTIETKFNRNDLAWAILENRPMQVKICCINIFLGILCKKPTIKYAVSWYDHLGRYHSLGVSDNAFVSEDLLFPTKEELIKSL